MDNLLIFQEKKDDLYINTVNGDYYKKTDAGWGNSIASLQGVQGSQIYYADGDPNEINPEIIADANVGDLYINRVNGKYYKKNNEDNRWDELGDLKGDEGKRGPGVFTGDIDVLMDQAIYYTVQNP